MSTKDSRVDAERVPMPTRNPLPLSATQEAQIREHFYARVKSHCAAEIKEFAKCADGLTLSVPFACRGPLRAMNGCMKSHATEAESDAARQEWFEQRVKRQRERERKEVKKAAQEDFMREWWGMPERDPETKKKVAERLAMKEKIGGMTKPSPPSDSQ